MPWDEELKSAPSVPMFGNTSACSRAKQRAFQSSTGIPFPITCRTPTWITGNRPIIPLRLFADLGRTVQDHDAHLARLHLSHFYGWCAGALFCVQIPDGDWKYGLLGSLFVPSPRFLPKVTTKDMVVMALVILLIAAGIKLIRVRRISSTSFLLSWLPSQPTCISALFMFGLLSCSTSST